MRSIPNMMTKRNIYAKQNVISTLDKVDQILRSNAENCVSLSIIV